MQRIPACRLDIACAIVAHGHARSAAMGRQAIEVYTDPADIAELEQRVVDLAVNARVRITTRQGEIVEGTVAVTSTVQVFFDPDGNEGINGVAILEDARRPGWLGEIWLGDIRRIEHLDSVVMGVSKA
jgi:hypothetical protein